MQGSSHRISPELPGVVLCHPAPLSPTHVAVGLSIWTARGHESLRGRRRRTGSNVKLGDDDLVLRGLPAVGLSADASTSLCTKSFFEPCAGNPFSCSQQQPCAQRIRAGLHISQARMRQNIPCRDVSARAPPSGYTSRHPTPSVTSRCVSSERLCAQTAS